MFSSRDANSAVPVNDVASGNDDIAVNVKPVNTYEMQGDDADIATLHHLPWYRRPSPWWLLCSVPIIAIAIFACSAPRVEIYTRLVCIAHRPEYSANGGSFSTGPHVTSLLPPSLASLLDHDDRAGTLGTLDPRCASDPVVQAAVAKLITLLMATQGILSCLATTFWSSMSDRCGRLRVLGYSVVGLLTTDLLFIIVYFFSDKLPGGYWFLLLGAIIEGSFGGITTIFATAYAYMADCAAQEARSRIYSIAMGLIFIGMGVGPTIGSLLIHVTASPISVFYLGLVVHFVFAASVWFIFPESRSKHAMRQSRTGHMHVLSKERTKMENMLSRVDRSKFSGVVQRVVLHIFVRVRRFFSAFQPLAIFVPKKIGMAPSASVLHRDWSLALVAFSYGCSQLIIASVQYKIQYAAATFGWTSEELGYYMSVMGAARATYLVLILPVAIRFLKRRSPAIQLPIKPSESLRPTPVPLSSSSIADLDNPCHAPPSPVLHRNDSPLPINDPHPASFDLGLARVSLAFEAVCYALMSLIPSLRAFILLSIIASFATGFSPAVNSVALELYTQRYQQDGKGSGNEELETEGDVSGLQDIEACAASDVDGEFGALGTHPEESNVGKSSETGQLFGALGVVQVLSSQILGPALLGVTYMKTVSIFPRSLFAVIAISSTIGFIAIACVRLPDHNHSMPLGPESATSAVVVAAAAAESPDAASRHEAAEQTWNVEIESSDTGTSDRPAGFVVREAILVDMGVQEYPVGTTIS